MRETLKRAGVPTLGQDRNMAERNGATDRCSSAAAFAPADDPALERLLALAGEELDADVMLLGPGVVGRVPPRGREVPLIGPDGCPRGLLQVVARNDDDDTAGVDRILRMVAALVNEHLDARALRREDREQRVQRIRNVLESGILPIVYQPITDLYSGEIVGVEALSRFPAPPDRAPDRWFAEASAVGLGTQLEVLAVRRAIEAFDRLPEHAYLSVNVSPVAAMSEELAEAVAHVPLDRLVLEITEHTEVADYDALNAAVERLRSGGARLAVDDTGSGFASMRHVLRLAPDIVKLDTSLTHGIDNDSVLRALGYSLKSFAAAIDAQVIAEGIETEREMDALRFLGVAFGQGYFLCPPGPLPTVEVLEPVGQQISNVS